MEWQTLAAALVTTLTAGIFLFRLLRRPRRGGCDCPGGCHARVRKNNGADD